MPQNPVTRVADDGRVVDMELGGLLVRVIITRKVTKRGFRWAPVTRAMNPSSGAVYTGRDIPPFIRRRAPKTAMAIFRDRQLARSRSA